MRRRRQSGFCIRGYRYCGPGCSGPGSPTNDVDACCRVHDLCYKRHGGASPYCDQLFINCLQPKINRHTKKGRDAALFTNFMKLRQSLRF